MPSPLYSRNILLAEDDDDDCLIFRYALEELSLAFNLTTVKNGEELMLLLNDDNARLPDVVFLDINMPRKNGFECLLEIKNNKRLETLPVIIFSTSFFLPLVERLYADGAHYYVRKPNEVGQLQKAIYEVLSLTAQPGCPQPSLKEFVLTF
ncbi:MAG: response regulator [Ferruginibacter sp.]